MTSQVVADATSPLPASVSSLRGSAIASLGTALPSRIVSNGTVAAELGVTESWIVKRTGIRQRHHARSGERLTGLAATAAREALERIELHPSEIDLVLVASCSQDEILPNAAPLVAGEIGAVHAGAIDIGAACTGFVSALMLGAAQIESGRADNVLIIGAEVLSKYLHPRDRRTAALFGDGAGAVVMRPARTDGALNVGALATDPDGADFIRISRAEGRVRMKGGSTFKHAVDRLVEITHRALTASGLSTDDIDLFVYHQANGRILTAVRERVGVPPERLVDAIGPTGNTSAASIPLALASAERSGALRSGCRVLLAAIGSGLTYGALVVDWAGNEPDRKEH